MPILPYESDIYPDTLLEFPPANAKWWAVYTLSRQEKTFMRRLRQLQVPHYGPLFRNTIRNIKLSGRHARAAFVPLFPGYVFVYGNDEQRQEALKTQCVFRILDVPDESELINDLRQIRQLIALGARLSPEPRLLPRRKARIQSGRFAGIEGTVLSQRGKESLVVAVKYLQCGVSVTLEDFEMESLLERTP
jgi:transcriptional antiterminator RfaH